jgi:hypothetical protein
VSKKCTDISGRAGKLVEEEAYATFIKELL